MENIRLTSLTHRGKACIALHLAFNITINTILKALPCATWSRTHKCWYIPLQEADVSKKQLVNIINPLDDLWKKKR